MALSGNYLVLFPTPGGDKYHMFRFTPEGCAVENSLGPTPLENYTVSDTGFSGDMPAGPTVHHFDGVLDGVNIKVDAKVLEGTDGKVINNYDGLLEPFDGDVLPENPESEGGPGGPGGPEGMPPMGGPGGPPPAR